MTERAATTVKRLLTEGLGDAVFDALHIADKDALQKIIDDFGLVGEEHEADWELVWNSKIKDMLQGPDVAVQLLKHYGIEVNY